MKKLFAASLMITMLSAAVFAQVKDGITIGAWGQAVLAPVVATLDDDSGGKDSDVYAGVGAGFQNRPRLRVDINGAGPDGKYGFTLRISTNDLSAFSVQNYARVWAAPISQVRIDAGKFRDDSLMGKIVDNDSFNYVLAMKDGNSIFNRFDSGGGALLSLKPITGLFVGAKVDLPAIEKIADGSLPTIHAETWYKKPQVAVAYTIPDVGLVRAQFFGVDHSYYTKTANRIEAAFAFTGLKDLTLDVGFKYPIQLKNDDVNGVIQSPLHAAVGAKFAAGDFDITGRVDADFAGSSKTETTAAGTKTATSSSDAPEINIHLLPRYNLGFATLGLELGFIITGNGKTTTETTVSGTSTKIETTTDGGLSFGAGLWLFKSWGNGTAQVGVSFQPNSERPKGTYHQGFIAVPLIFTYSF
jgi:hypothetical protein